MSTSPKQDSSSLRSFTKNSIFFKASAIKPTGTLYSDTNSQTTKKPTNNLKSGYSFVKLDSSLTKSEKLPDTVTTDLNLDNSEVTENTSPQTQTEFKATGDDTGEETKVKDTKQYVFGQKIESRVVLHDSEGSETSSQDVKQSIPENSKPLLDSLPVQKVFTGEEGEKVKVEISCKLYVFDSSNKTWHSKGRNLLHLNEDSEEEHKSRIICRSQGNQLVLLNSPIWSEMLCELSNANSIKFSANLQEEGIRVVLIQGEKRDIANLYTALQAVISNCILHKEATVTSTTPQDTPDTEPNLNDSPDVSCPLTPPPPPPHKPTDPLPNDKLTFSRKRSIEETGMSEDKSLLPDSTQELEEGGTANSSKRSKVSDLTHK